MLKPTLTFLATALALSGASSHGQSTNRGEDLTHSVRYDLGDTHFLPGDSITIDSITGTADKVSPAISTR